MFKVLILVGLLAQNVYQSEAACIEGNFYAHETECAQFYQCVGGKLHIQQCPATLEFSTKINVCTWPEESGCNLNKVNGGENSNCTTAPPCTSPTTCTPSPTTCTTPSPTTCTTPSSTTCTTPSPTTCTTPSPTTCTTPSPTTCTTPSPTTCTPSPTPTSSCSPPTSTDPPPPPCTDPPNVDIPQPYPGCPNCIADPSHDVLLSLPKCCQFVHCTNFGIGVVKNCAPSDPPLVFSECLQRCVWPWEAVNATCEPCTC